MTNFHNILFVTCINQICKSKRNFELLASSLKVEVIGSFTYMTHIVGWPSCEDMRHCLVKWGGVGEQGGGVNLKEIPHSLQLSRSGKFGKSCNDH